MEALSGLKIRPAGPSDFLNGGVYASAIAGNMADGWQGALCYNRQLNPLKILGANI
jgi:hypothetical protein